MVDGAWQPNAAHVIRSPRLVRQLGAPSSTLRAFLEREDSAIFAYVGGEVDACNESTWRCLLGEAAGAVAPGAVLIVDLTGLKFISCGALEILTKQFHWCRRSDIPMRLVTKQEVIRQIVRAHIPTGALPIFPSAMVALGHTEERPA
jgi:anti-anti-sigma factor